ncbi:MAG: hypothetical protein HZC40_01920 [Chloroflexi bacterium]|nr:hypothetical protein [Chloroflexota bacterium]
MKTRIQKGFSSFILHPSSLHLFLILAFCLPALAPLTAPGYFSAAHDARHSIYFLQMFDLSVRDGAWFPRWAADMVFGYGYPLWVILAPLPFFLGEAFHLIGFDFVASVKIVDGLALFFSALAMYLFAARALANKNAALVAAIAYVYVPYHLVDLYVRAAQAELVSFIFPPLIFWAFHRLAETRAARDLAFAALAYAGLLLSHISMAVIFTPIIGLYLLFLLVQLTNYQLRFTNYVLRFTLYAGGAILLALGIAAIFLLPVLFEQRYLKSDALIGGFFDYRKHFLSVAQLFSPFWGYGYAGENGNDQFSLQLGLIPVMLALGALWSLPRGRGAMRAHTIFFLLIVIAIVLAVLPIATPLWEMFAGVIAFVQFPWRVLIVSAFALAFLAGAAINALDDARDRAPALAVILLFVIAHYPYTQPQHNEARFNYAAQMDFEVRERELLGDTIWLTGERPLDSPLVAQYRAGEKLTRAISLDAHATVETIRYGGQSVEARVTARAPARIQFYTRYFPGWRATLDDQPLDIEPFGEQGLILARVPAGSHAIKIRFEDTPIRQIAAFVSGISVLIAGALIATGRLKSRHATRKAKATFVA